MNMILVVKLKALPLPAKMQIIISMYNTLNQVFYTLHFTIWILPSI